MSQREEDLQMLSTLLDEHADEMSEVEAKAFADMRWDMTGAWPGYFQLTEKQCAWVKSVLERIVPEYGNLVTPTRHKE